MIAQNNFWQDLEYSHSQSDQPWWEEVYRKAFVDFSAMHDVRKKGWWQEAGIDRQIILTNSKVITVDEKVRREDYQDFALEVLSDRDKGTPGWMHKPLACDYIAYAFEPSRRCYLLPVKQLQRAYHTNKHQWAKKYRRIDAPNPKVNPRYWTSSICVPIPVVLDAIRDAMFVTWSPPEPTPLHQPSEEVPF